MDAALRRVLKMPHIEMKNRYLWGAGANLKDVTLVIVGQHE